MLILVKMRIVEIKRLTKNEADEAAGCGEGGGKLATLGGQSPRASIQVNMIIHNHHHHQHGSHQPQCHHHHDQDGHVCQEGEGEGESSHFLGSSHCRPRIRYSRTILWTF